LTDPDGRIFRWAMRAGVNAARRVAQGELDALRETVAGTSPPIRIVRIAAQQVLAMAPRRLRTTRRKAGADVAGPDVWGAGGAAGGLLSGARRLSSDLALAPGYLGQIGRIATSRYQHSSGACAVSLANWYDSQTGRMGIARHENSSGSGAVGSANWFDLPACSDPDGLRLTGEAAAVVGSLSVRELVGVGRRHDGPRRSGAKTWRPSRGPSTLDLNTGAWARAIPRGASSNGDAIVGGAEFCSRQAATGHLAAGSMPNVPLSMTDMHGGIQAMPVASAMPWAGSSAGFSGVDRLLPGARGEHGTDNAPIPSGGLQSDSGREQFARWFLERLTRNAGRPDAGASFFNGRQSPAWSGVTIGL